VCALQDEFHLIEHLGQFLSLDVRIVSAPRPGSKWSIVQRGRKYLGLALGAIELRDMVPSLFRQVRGVGPCAIP